jgi:antirestriction protein ArdC
MQNFHSNPAQRRDHYQELTEKIIVALEAGTAPWRRPWDKTACGGAVAPVNAATGHRYHGINLFVLGMSPLAFASNDPRWCTYRQAGSRGWQVRKGEKATPVYFYKPIEIEDQTSGSGRETRRIPMLRTFPKVSFRNLRGSVDAPSLRHDRKAMDPGRGLFRT